MQTTTNATTTNANAFTSPSARARRDAYDASYANASLRDIVTFAQRERVTFAQRASMERIARQSRDVPTRTIARDVTPSAWELDAPRDVARPSDRTCHHPLVNCVHKW